LGSKSTAIGYAALQRQNFTTATDSFNVAVGHLAGENVTTGIQNALIGPEVALSLTEGSYNVALGRRALQFDQKGNRSVAIGYNALFTQRFTTATDAYNTAVGFNAGEGVTTGTSNTFIGGVAGDLCTTGSGNTAVGTSAMTSSTITGDDNTAVGVAAMAAISSGSNNLALGHDAGRTGSPGGNITTADNHIALGDENITSANVQVDWGIASDERDKTDFSDLNIGLDFVKALEPVTYYWDKRSKYGDKNAEDYDLDAQTPDGTHKEDWMDIGFKAQSVQALEEAAGYDLASKKNLTVSVTEDGKQYSLQYSKFVPILVKAVQELSAQVTALQAEVNTLKGG